MSKRSSKVHPITAAENRLALAIHSGNAAEIEAAKRALETLLNATAMPAFIA
jgi:hypothetical protein